MPLMRSRLLPKLPWKALYFDGVDDRVEIPLTTELDLTLPISAMAWFRPIEPLGQMGIVGIDAHSWLLYLRSSPGKDLAFRSNDGAGTDYFIMAGNADYGEWNFLAGVLRQDGTGFLYHNGEIISTNVQTASYPRPSNNIYIGYGASLASPRYFYGEIAAVYVYNRALTEEEVEWNYYHPDDPVRSGLVLWLHYDSIDETNNVWRDKTAYHNDGTIYGATPVEFTKPPIRKLSPTRILSPVR